VTSLNRHVGNEGGEAIIDVEPDPSEQEIVQTWDWASNAMLGACVGVNLILGNTPAGLGLRQLGDRYHALTTLRPKGEIARSPLRVRGRSAEAQGRHRKPASASQTTCRSTSSIVTSVTRVLPQNGP
jgi:hypothetical protein